MSVLRSLTSLNSFKGCNSLFNHSFKYFSSHFSHIQQGPPDPILGVAEAFRAETAPNKINVSVGAYRDDNGKPVVLKSVKEAENRVMNSSDYNHEYLPIGGIPELCKQSQQLAFGENDNDLDSIVTLQSLSGTGSLRLLAGFLARHWHDTSNLPTIYLPNPTWGNHLQIFNHMGMKTEYYRYYNPNECNLDFNNMITDLNNLPSNSVCLFHATAHNPTGVDPNESQWDEICDLLKKKGNLVVFDMAYQGFASGDCDKDAYSLRKFKSSGNTFMLAQSFAKNFGLYGQRAGAASIICSNTDEKKKVESQFKIVARALYSNPPSHGGKIVSTILGDKQLKQQWLKDVKEMADRIISMRQLLRSNIENSGSNKSWKHVTDQIGMFTFTGLNPQQCDELTNKHKIYLTRNGRISMAGVNSKNVKILAEAIHDVTK